MKISVRKLTALMGANLMTQKDLAQKAGVSRATISGTVQKGSCSVQTTDKIAKALGVEPAKIVEMED